TALGTYAVGDAAAAMNADEAGLPFDISNGSFFIHVTHGDSQVRTAHEIHVNGDMSMDDLVNQINTVVGVPNITASVVTTSEGLQLQLAADQGYAMSFSDDSSGALAALGVNTFFTGHSAATMDVNQTIIENPAL